jgi:hypothetical protein
VKGGSKSAVKKNLHSNLKEGYLPQGVASNRQIEHRSRRNKKLKL